MKEKFKQTSFFSTFKRKLDIFKWQVKKSNREEPILLGIKSTRCVRSSKRNQMIVMEFIWNIFFRNNCEVPCDDFEYFDSRNNNCDRIKQIVEKTSPVRPVLTRHYRNKGTTSQINHQQISNWTFSESEIEIFERKFLSSLVIPESTSTSTSLVIPQNPSSSSSSSLVTVTDGVRTGPSRVMTSGLLPHHRVLRTSSKVAPLIPWHVISNLPLFRILIVTLERTAGAPVQTRASTGSCWTGVETRSRTNLLSNLLILFFLL